MNEVEIIKDGIGLKDGYNTKSTFQTSVTIKDAETGKILGCDKRPNMTILGGRVATLESLFGITPNPSHRVLLNSIDVLNIPHDKNPFDPDAPLSTKARKVGWFMFGVGAEQPSFPGKYFKPKNYETMLYQSAPFRCVPIGADLTTWEQEKYRLRKEITIDGNRFYAYYAKKFDLSTINVEFNEAAYNPIPAHTIPVLPNDTSHPLSGGEVLTFVQFTLTIEEAEFKEWYRLTNNNTLEDARITELGLVIGSDLPNDAAGAGGRLELAAAEMFAKITHSPVYLDTEHARRIVEYMIFT